MLYCAVVFGLLASAMLILYVRLIELEGKFTEVQRTRHRVYYSYRGCQRAQYFDSATEALEFASKLTERHSVPLFSISEVKEKKIEGKWGPR